MIKGKHKFICERCKNSEVGWSNQRFCDDCGKMNEKEHKKVYDKEYYKRNAGIIKHKQLERYHKNYIPHPRKLLSESEKKQKGKDYYLRDKDRIRGVHQKYKEGNRSNLREKSKEYYKNNPDKIKKHREKYKSRRREINRIYIKKKRNEDVQFNIKEKLRARIHSALKRYTTTGKIKKSDEYGINFKAIIEHLKPFPEDLSKYHIDHIKPLCSFDLTKPEEIKKAFAPENHRWMLKKENLKKGGKERSYIYKDGIRIKQQRD